MTIAERKAREAHDRENPWRPMGQQPPVGLICDLLMDDMMGHYPADASRFFFDVDGRWHRMEPPGEFFGKPINWRPSYCFLTPERRSYLKKFNRKG